MIVGTIYKISTGAVVMTVQGPDEDNVHLQCTLDPDYAAFVGEQVDGEKFYFKDGQPTLRTVMDVKFEPASPDSEDSMIKLGREQVLRVTGIPEGTRLIAPGNVDMIVDDGYFEWETDVRGNYHFSLFKDQSYTGVAFHAIVG